jgi:hypothetical protein
LIFDLPKIRQNWEPEDRTPGLIDSFASCDPTRLEMSLDDNMAVSRKTREKTPDRTTNYRQIGGGRPPLLFKFVVLFMPEKTSGFGAEPQKVELKYH